MLDADELPGAAEASQRFRDRPVRQFWDGDGKLGKEVGRSLGADGWTAWDIYLFYPPGAEWNDRGLPAPGAALAQAGGVVVGTTGTLPPAGNQSRLPKKMVGRADVVGEQSDLEALLTRVAEPFAKRYAATTARGTDLKDVSFESLKFHDADNAMTYERPQGLEVLLTGVAVEGPAIVARGFIENRTATPLGLTLQMPGGFFFSMSPSAAVKPPAALTAPPLPEVFPWPRVFEIPAKSRVPWSASKGLDGYTWSGAPKVDVTWTVAVWSEANGRGVFGTASVELPRR